MSELTIAQMLDEKRIEQVLVRYARALDERDWAALDDVFTEDASAQYQTIGHFSGRRAVVDVVRDAMSGCGRTQHLLGNVAIEIDGDQARARCYIQAIHGGIGERAADTLTVWGEYRDRLSRVEGGWRITHRELEIYHMAGGIGPTALTKD